MYYSPGKEYFIYLALSIFSLAVLSDAADGFIARRKKQCSELGAYLDPIADKLLLLVSFISLSVMGNIPDRISMPAWVTLLVITRDGIILIGSGLIYLIKGKLDIQPSVLGKSTTFAQMFLIFSVLLSIPMPFRSLILYFAVFLTIISGADYIRRGSRILNCRPE